MELEEVKLNDFLENIFLKYGYDFRLYSRASLTRRITRFMNLLKLESVETLESKLLTDESSFRRFVEEITVNVTEMFRDPGFYRTLRATVIPQLKTYPFVRIWCAGCATGEEVYSLAICLYEEGLYDRCQIYATDINPKVVEDARKGIYNLSLMRDYTLSYLHAGGKEEFSNYYSAKYNSAIFHSFLKKNIVFSVHNLATDGSFNEFNLIICRNVLIYFQRSLQEKVVNLFVESLPVFGYLGLGSKETLSLTSFHNLFEDISHGEKLYQRIKP